jgi:thermitase
VEIALHVIKNQKNNNQLNNHKTNPLMKKTSTLLLALACCLNMMAQKVSYVQNEVIVKFKSACPSLRTTSGNQLVTTGWLAVDELNQLYGCKSAQKIFSGANASSYPEAMQNVYTLHFSGDVNIMETIKQYLSTGQVDYAEPNYIYTGAGANGTRALIPNDAKFSPNQYGMRNTGTPPTDYTGATKAGADIDATLAWEITTGDTNTVVAIIDSGTKLDHPELSGRIWRNYKEIQGNNKDDDNNGLIDDYRGWNYSDNNNNPIDAQGHGTNVAGIVGATGNNGIGYAGMNWKCKLMILRVLDDTGGGNNDNIAKAITYAADNGAKVINLSLESSSASTTMETAINYAYNTKNALCVAAAGNGNTSTVQYPAGFANVMAVGSTSPDDTRTVPFFGKITGGSNYGNHLSVCAPGNIIYGLNHQSNTDYSWRWGGTSQATPHVAGLASLLLAQNPSLSPAQMRSIIETTAEDQVGKPTEDVKGKDPYHGWGRINAYQALLQIATSIKDAITFNSAKVFPNPTTDRVIITLPELATNSLARLSIYNYLGAEIKQDEQQTSSNGLELNFMGLESGMYMVKITSSNNQSFYTKVIKQ